MLLLRDMLGAAVSLQQAAEGITTRHRKHHTLPNVHRPAAALYALLVYCITVCGVCLMARCCVPIVFALCIVILQGV